jgi:hypothetical protein
MAKRTFDQPRQLRRVHPQLIRKIDSAPISRCAFARKIGITAGALSDALNHGVSRKDNVRARLSQLADMVAYSGPLFVGRRS